MVNVSREEITDGALVRSLLLLAAPLVAQNLVQVAQQVIDTFWVGRLGENAVAAVGVNFPVIAFIYSATVVVNTGTQVVVSQRVGGDDAAGGRRTAFHGATLALFGAIACAILVSVGAETLVELLVDDDAVAALATTYLVTYMFGFPFSMTSDALEFSFIGWGDSRAALYINLTAIGVNVALDPFLILGWGPFAEMGVRGAALATVIGYAAGLLLALGMILRGRDGLTFTENAVGFDVEEYREVLEVGLPTGAQRAVSQLVRVLIIALVSAVGGAAGLAAYTVGARIASVAFIPAQGLSGAAQSVVGQNLGADNPGRARRATWVSAGIAAVGLTLAGVVQWVAPELLVNFFVADISQRALGLSVDYLKILVLGYWAIGATYAFNAGFNGARRTKVSMVVGLLKYWAVRLPIAAVGAFWFDFDVHAVFWAVTISNVAGAVGAGLYYYYTTNNGMLERAAEKATAAAD
ncbi:MATE family efflux transporter [Halorussus limi]|uniref:Multidrug-efflux transporter n=1 Tax=Halorussus limi TaxID=2938695 RepID=A0A8U0HYG9_9EURY|nr:MATE family efflux transporter [Halorussus limi]UPV75751.1 MATE family efflux transporter [Halorussus limi]